MANNYTPIDDLENKVQERQAVSKPIEVEPITLTKESAEIKEVVEHQPEKEVRPYITPRHETIELPPDLKSLGVQSTTTTNFPAYQNVKLPISDDKVLVGLNAPISSSFRWLATLALYILRMAHLSLKRVHGHVVRVLQR